MVDEAQSSQVAIGLEVQVAIHAKPLDQEDLLLRVTTMDKDAAEDEVHDDEITFMNVPVMVVVDAMEEDVDALISIHVEVMH